MVSASRTAAPSDGTAKEELKTGRVPQRRNKAATAKRIFFILIIPFVERVVLLARGAPVFKCIVMLIHCIIGCVDSYFLLTLFSNLFGAACAEADAVYRLGAGR